MSQVIIPLTLAGCVLLVTAGLSFVWKRWQPATFEPTRAFGVALFATLVLVALASGVGAYIVGLPDHGADIEEYEEPEQRWYK